MIDTDSPTDQAAAARSEFPQVLVVDRPKHLRDGETPMNDVLLNTIKQVTADIYLQTHSTNPLLSAETIETAIATFRAARGRNDSLFGVTRHSAAPVGRERRPVNHDPAVLMRTQDLAPIFVENSTMYLFTRESLTSTGNRIGRTPMMFEVDKLEAHDIDDEADFVIAEMLYRQRKSAARSSTREGSMTSSGMKQRRDGLGAVHAAGDRPVPHAVRRRGHRTVRAARVNERLEEADLLPASSATSTA